jgi:hypothetical protein
MKCKHLIKVYWLDNKFVVMCMYCDYRKEFKSEKKALKLKRKINGGQNENTEVE